MAYSILQVTERFISLIISLGIMFNINMNSVRGGYCWRGDIINYLAQEINYFHNTKSHLDKNIEQLRLSCAKLTPTYASCKLDRFCRALDVGGSLLHFVK